MDSPDRSSPDASVVSRCQAREGEEVVLQTGRVAGVVALVILLAACGSPPQFSGGPTGGESAAAPAAPRAPKILTIAMQAPLANFAAFTGAAAAGGDIASGNNNVALIAHNYLALSDQGIFRPQLATALPSVEDGTWRVNADGTMDTTWKLRPNVKWQDGVPFTADDMVFTYMLFHDAEFPAIIRSQERLMQSASAPDPLTFVVHWSTVSATGGDPTYLSPMPKHLLEDLYRTDKTALVNSPLLTSQFVGLGPYRIVNWQPGVGIDFVRFDDYYLGRPPLDQVILKYIPDASTAVANILAGSVDVVYPPSVELDTAAQVKQQWEGTGNQVLTTAPSNEQFLRPQFRPDVAQPRNGLTNVQVRKALNQSIDRAGVIQVATAGLAPMADSWVPPTFPWRAQLESSIPVYPHDLAQAQRLLSEAGWVKGADGVLVHQASGERFESTLSGRQTTGVDRILAVIADGWKPLGVQLGISVLPAAGLDRRTLANRPFAQLSSMTASPTRLPPMNSADLATEANNWSGANWQGYSNPQVDDLINRVQSTIDEREQIALSAQLVQVGMGDVAIMPLFWEVQPLLLVKGVKPSSDLTTRNMFEWDKE